MSRRGLTSAPVGLHEVEDRARHLAELNVAAAQLVGDIHGHVTGPSFGGVEGHYADRMPILALHEVADQHLAVSVVCVGLAPEAAHMSVVLQHEICVVVSLVGHNRWRSTHNETP